MDPKAGGKTVATRSFARLTEEDVRAAKRLLALLADEQVVTVTPSSGSTAAVSRERLLNRARQILDNRNKRALRFGRAMFGEPAWDMLLLLYVLEDGPRQNVTRLAELSGTSRSTALRWIDYLEAQHLVTREEHPTDRRSAFIAISESGREAMRLYLTDTIAKGR